MEALDSYIPLPQREIDKPFLMPIEDVFSISGRGTVVTGRVERGKVKVGEEIEIVGFKPTEKKVVTGVEMFRKLLDEGVAGDNIGVLLRGVEKTDVERGQVLAKPGSITPHTKFKGEVYILSKEEGGRHTPFFNGYRPQFYIRTTDVTGSLKLPEGVEMVMPGDNTSINAELHVPVALEKGARFAIREGGRTVGAGTITEIDMRNRSGIESSDPDVEYSHARHHFPGVQRVQTSQLQHDQEQEEDQRAADVQQVLPLLPQARDASGDEVSRSEIWKCARLGSLPLRADASEGERPSEAARTERAERARRSESPRSGEAPREIKDSSSIGRAPVSKTGGWGFDSLLSCQIGRAVGERRAGSASAKNDEGVNENSSGGPRRLLRRPRT